MKRNSMQDCQLRQLVQVAKARVVKQFNYKLAVTSGLALGLVLGSASRPAHAGHWALTYETQGTDLGSSWDTSNITPPPYDGAYGQYAWKPNAYYAVSHYMYCEPTISEWAEPSPQLDTSSIGHITAVFTWALDGPNDTSTPPPYLYVKEVAQAGASNIRSDPFAADNGLPAASNVINAGPMGKFVTGVHIAAYAVPSSGIVRVNQRHLSATSNAARGSNIDDAYYDGDQLTAQLFYQTERLAFSPDPNGHDLMTDPDDGAILNQYIISGVAGAPFTIPCFVDYGYNTTLLDNQVGKFSWSIARPPLPQYGIAPNGVSYPDNYSGAHIYARFWQDSIPSATPQPSPLPPPATPTPIGPPPTPAPTPTPIAGMGFVTANGLPQYNSAFGPNVINHFYNGSTLAQAPIALFFDSTVSTHPMGGPISNDGSPVPNYIYYYSQVYPAPWNTEVRFWNEDYSAYPRGLQYICTGTDSHGLSGAGAYGDPDLDGGIDTDMFAKIPAASPSTDMELVWVGKQKIRGLDLYARNVYHECVHKRLYEYAQLSGIPDNDGDGSPDNADSDNDSVPDYVEDSIGTNKFSNNSVPGWYLSNGREDGEVLCRMCERDLPVGSEDWASDGFNYGRPAPPNRWQGISFGGTRRIVESYWPNYTPQNLTWVNARGLIEGLHGMP